jgi:hypothetical protein
MVGLLGWGSLQMKTQTEKTQTYVFEPSNPVFEWVKTFRALGLAASMYLMNYSYPVVGIEALTAIVMQNSDFLYLAPCSPVEGKVSKARR